MTKLQKNTNFLTFFSSDNCTYHQVFNLKYLKADTYAMRKLDSLCRQLTRGNGDNFSFAPARAWREKLPADAEL